MIVSYGGHGGVKAAAQLKQVLEGVRMRVVGTMPALTFPDKGFTMRACKGEDVGLLADGEDVGLLAGGEGEKRIWEDEKEGIWKGFEELMGLLGEK